MSFSPRLARRTSSPHGFRRQRHHSPIGGNMRRDPSPNIRPKRQANSELELTNTLRPLFPNNDGINTFGAPLAEPETDHEADTSTNQPKLDNGLIPTGVENLPLVRLQNEPETDEPDLGRFPAHYPWKLSNGHYPETPFPYAPGFGPDVGLHMPLYAPTEIGDTGENIPNINVYQHRKTLAQGMMDLALFSANANQLRYVLESFGRHPFYYPSVALISISLIMQVAVGIGLIWNARYNILDQKEIYIANKVSNKTIIGIFIVTVINVFISAFGVSPVAVTATSP